MIHKFPEGITGKHQGTSKKSTAAATNGMLHRLAFDNSLHANIISSPNKLLDYSKKELLTKNRADCFNMNESNFKKMLNQRIAEGQSQALVKAIKKVAGSFPIRSLMQFFRMKMVLKNQSPQLLI